MKKRVLFVCVHNGARSQMAEALLKHHCGDYCFEAASAGVHPGEINSLAIEVMAELGIDISRHRTKSIFEFIRQQPTFDYVITVDESRGQHCPQFPRKTVHVQWDFPDPATFTGTRAERLARTRDVRDQILACIEGWCAQVCKADEREADRPADQWQAAPPLAPQGMPP